MKDTIQTLHPKKKQGVNISKKKYDIIRKSILSILRKHKEMPFMKLSQAVEKDVRGKFEGSVMWYVTTVKLDLEARGKVNRIPHSRPQIVKLGK